MVHPLWESSGQYFALPKSSCFKGEEHENFFSSKCLYRMLW